MKICNKCKKEKELTEFNKDLTRKDGLKYKCRECDSKTQKEYYILNKKEHNKRTSKYYVLNKEEHNKRTSKWKSDNYQYYLNYQKEYRIQNIINIREYDNNWKKERKKNDINFKLRVNIRERIRDALKKNYKKGKTLELLGCSVEEYKKYLENQFTEEMNWENYGKIWEIDHIKQLNLFNLELEEDKKQAFNYINTRPLLKSDNRRRSKKQ